MKLNLTTIFLLFFIFLDPIYYCVLTFLKISDARYLSQTLMVATPIAFLIYVLNSRPILRKESICFIGVIVFGILFYLTSVYYGYVHETYWNKFLKWMSLGNSSLLVGIVLNKKKGDYYFESLMKFLPLLILFLTIVISTSTTKGYETDNGQFHDDFGLGYQSMAYYLALLFACSAYHCFVYLGNGVINNSVKILLMGCMGIQVVMCAMSGGRGGMVLMGSYILFYSLVLFRKKHSKLKFIIAFFILALTVLVLADYFNIWKSSGFERSTGNFNENSRFDYWVLYLPQLLDAGVFGSGIGSIYYDMGNYSHNLFLDFFIECGIIGGILLCYVYYKIFKKLVKFSSVDPKVFFVLILFIYSFIVNFFSGYWPTSEYNWLALGFVISYKPKNKRIVKLKSK